MIKKILFEGLSSKTFTYTAIGGIRFFDAENNELDILGSTTVSDTATYYETDIISITATNTYINGTNYNIGNCYRNDRDLGYNVYEYWLSSYDEQKHTLELKDGNEWVAISKFSYNPVPSGYTNRGISEPFTVSFYNENDELLAQYTITPDTSVNNTVYYQETPELMYDFYTLFYDDNYQVYYYNNADFVALNKVLSNLTATDFINNGVKRDFTISDVSILDQFGGKLNTIVYDTIKLPISLNESFIPETQYIILNNINLADFNSISQIFFDYSIDSGDDIKVLLNNDAGWYKYNLSTTSFDLINSNTPDLDILMTQGNTPEEINDIPSEILNNFLSDTLKIYIGAQISQYNTNTSISNILINGVPKPMYQEDTANHVIEQGISGIYITFNADGNYIVQYI